MTRRLKQEIDLDSGIIVAEKYLLKRHRHRDPQEGPAVIERDPKTGTVTLEEYWVKGWLGRQSGPAIIKRDAVSGMVCVEEYRHHGMLNRDPAEGPAHMVRYAPTGIVTIEQYWRKGIVHRDRRAGPALIHRDGDTGKILTWEYWEDGHRVAPPPGARRLHRRKPEPSP